MLLFLYFRVVLFNINVSSQKLKMTTNILERKKRLEYRLASHGITDCPITYLPYLEFDNTTFVSPYEAGCRMMILYALAYTASKMGDRQKIVDWLKSENIWIHVSPKEFEFFDGKITDEQITIDFSWEGEAAYILAWALNIIPEVPTPTEQITKEQLNYFTNKVPAFGESIDHFLTNLTYRNTTEIYDENLFHELATAYFRNLLFSENPDTSNVDRGVSFLRHRTLNCSWLPRFLRSAL